MYYLCLFCFKRPASLQSTTPWRMLAEALPPPAWVLSHMLLSPQVPDQITAQAGMTSTQFYPVDVRVSHFCRATTSKLESDPLVTSAPSRSTQASSYDKTHRGIFTANPRSGWMLESCSLWKRMYEWTTSRASCSHWIHEPSRLSRHCPRWTQTNWSNAPPCNNTLPYVCLSGSTADLCQLRRRMSWIFKDHALSKWGSSDGCPIPFKPAGWGHKEHRLCSTCHTRINVDSLATVRVRRGPTWSDVLCMALRVLQLEPIAWPNSFAYQEWQDPPGCQQMEADWGGIPTGAL